MDKVIDKKIRLPWTYILRVGIGGIAIVAILLIWSPGKISTVDVDSSRTLIAQVEHAEFEEYIPVQGVVLPNTTVFLDLQEGGIVDEVYIEDGNQVKKGDLILSFSNTTVQKQNIDSEARLLENLDRLRNSKLALTEKYLLLKEQLLDLDYQIETLKKDFNRINILRKNSPNLVSTQEYESMQDNLEYLIEKRVLLRERIAQENAIRDQQDEQIDKSIALVMRSLDVLQKIMDNMNLRAPIDGYLSSMAAEVGQNFVRGQRVGQIDQLDGFKVEAAIDQYYISKVKVGQEGALDINGVEHKLAVTKVYPEVVDNSFRVDMRFSDDEINSIKRGQTLQIDLTLSESKQTKTLRKGGFYRLTSGRWVYRLTNDGKSAERVSIVSGRQNPKYFEVLDGLNVGDWVVVSNYDIFSNADRINFSSAFTKAIQ